MEDVAAYLEAFNAPGAAARIALVAAHPDDETIGAAGLLMLAADAPRDAAPDITVLHVTDGAPRDGRDAQAAGCPDWRAYRALRRDELADAMAVAGFPAERLECLGYADQEAVRHLEELTHRLAGRFRDLDADVVLTHAYEGGHPDHDAAALAVHAAYEVLRRDGRRVPTVVEWAGYHGAAGSLAAQEFLPHPDAPVVTVPLAPRQQERKRRMLGAFASQARTLAPFGAEAERFRRAPRHAFTRPPHEGALMYEIWGMPITGEQWRRHADQALASMGLEASRWL